MRRLVLLAILVISTTSALGCSRFAGPLAIRNWGRADAPGYNLEEQQRRGRERYAITEDDWRIGPKGDMNRPSPTGR